MKFTTISKGVFTMFVKSKLVFVVLYSSFKEAIKGVGLIKSCKNSTQMSFLETHQTEQLGPFMNS